MQQIRLIILSVLLTMSCHALANIIPQAGLWSIVPESTGKPGRGLAIEVQGDTLILTVYGYTQDGRATFYLASGPYINGQFNADLGMYEGGTVLGGNPVPARYTGSAGTVNLSFNSETEGMVTLPGEEAKPITRFVTTGIVEIDLGYQLRGMFFQVDTGQADVSVIQSYQIERSSISVSPVYERKDEASIQIGYELSLDYLIEIDGKKIDCSLSGNFYQSGSAFASEGDYECTDNVYGKYRIKNLQPMNKTDSDSLTTTVYQTYLSGDFYFKQHGSEDEIRYVMKVTGRMIDMSDVVAGPQQFDRLLFLPKPFVLSTQNGLWWTAVESKGIPGRGFSLDRQGKTLVLTFFGYEEDGRSTFYIASGPFSSYNEFSAELLMVEGGTALGGTYIPAKITGSKGTVKLKFTSEVDGTITLPGEQEQTIKRFTADDASKRLMQEGGRFSGFYNATYHGFHGLQNIEYEFFLQDGRFELKSTTRGKYSSTECVYAGKYEPIGPALYSSGDYECVSKLLEGTYSYWHHTEYDKWVCVREMYSKGTYVIKDLSIDEQGIFSGNIQYSDRVYRFFDYSHYYDLASSFEELHIGGRYIEKAAVQQ